jgi:hypothetical protein
LKLHTADFRTWPAKGSPKGAKKEPKGVKREPKGAKKEAKGRQKEANKHPKLIQNGHRKQTEKHIEQRLPKATKRHQKGGQQVTFGRLEVDKRLHGTRDADMRETLACVCQNDIGEAVRPLKNIKKPPRDQFFRNSKKDYPKDAKNLPKGPPTEVKKHPKTTQNPIQNHIEKWSGEKPEAGSSPRRARVA